MITLTVRSVVSQENALCDGNKKHSSVSCFLKLFLVRFHYLQLCDFQKYGVSVKRISVHVQQSCLISLTCFKMANEH